MFSLRRGQHASNKNVFSDRVMDRLYDFSAIYFAELHRVSQKIWTGKFGDDSVIS